MFYSSYRTTVYYHVSACTYVRIFLVSSEHFPGYKVQQARVHRMRGVFLTGSAIRSVRKSLVFAPFTPVVSQSLHSTAWRKMADKASKQLEDFAKQKKVSYFKASQGHLDMCD